MSMIATFKTKAVSGYILTSEFLTYPYKNLISTVLQIIFLSLQTLSRESEFCFTNECEESLISLFSLKQIEFDLIFYSTMEKIIQSQSFLWLPDHASW